MHPLWSAIFGNRGGPVRFARQQRYNLTNSTLRDPGQKSMLDRRRFMQFTALAVTLPTAAGAHRSLERPISSLQIRLLSSAGPRDCEVFRSALGGACEPLASDPGDVVQELCAPGALADVDVIAGLTRSSDFLLISQLARERGMQLVFHGRHRYRNGRLEHVLAGGRAALGVLNQQLNRGPAPWPAILAQSIRSLSDSRVVDTRMAFAYHAAPPQGSPACFVSWAMRAGCRRS